ncbi:uncharacterized protein [Syngnathus scovelli]|uniref:uncharacterized protein isoform X3 n=1 Tax=Syngnathus scovelli TaxID=161590 RepID=UPI0035CC6F65
MAILKDRFNQSHGIHVFQVLHGCEYDDDSVSKSGFNHHSYDGDDTLFLDMENRRWIWLQYQLEATVRKWNHNKGWLEFMDHRLLEECPQRLCKMLEYGKSVLQRIQRPLVALLQTQPSALVTCHATGFYPNIVDMFWMRDGEQLHDHVTHDQLLPNHDGTFQLSVRLNVSAVPPEDWRRYACIFRLEGLPDKIITTLDAANIETNYDCLSEILAGAAVLYKLARRRRRGKRAGALVKLRQRGFRSALPSIHLANVRSLANKMDELLLLTSRNTDFSRSAALCFVETWLSERTPHHAMELAGFRLTRADRSAELSGKSKGGGLCFYINERWCTDVMVLKEFCSPLLETLFINCRPFYSPREFSSIVMAAVYIPPNARASEATQMLADQVTDMERLLPNSLIIVLGDLNRANLAHELPRYRPHITCPTRGAQTLDHCYTVIKDAYHSVARAALGLSDHCLVHLIPAYRQKLKTSKPVVRTVRKWTVESRQDLQGCFDCTDWSVFEAANSDLHELTDTVTSYISFCEDLCVQTKTFCTYNNDKPWFTPNLRRLRKVKEEAYRSGDRDLFKQTRNTLNREVRKARRCYGESLERHLSANPDPSTVWKGLQSITGFKKRTPRPVESPRLADQLNRGRARTPDS